MAETTIDHDKIRKWAESKGGKPAAVERTHSDDDVGIIRIMFPDAPKSEHGALVEISWEEFFDEFEDRKLALLYEEDSMFSKIVGRDTMEKREHGDHAASRHSGRGSEGSSKAEHRGSSGSGSKDEAHGKRHEGGKAHESGSKAASKGSGSKSSGSKTSESKRSESKSDEDRSLKSREYRDEDGTVHHHTKTYMEQHGGAKGEKK